MTTNDTVRHLVPRISASLSEIGAMPPGEARAIHQIQLRTWFDRLIQEDPHEADQLYADAFASTDKVLRTGLRFFMDFYLALWPRSSPVTHGVDDPATTKLTQTVTFAVFGEALLPGCGATRGFYDVDALAFWVCQHLMVPLASVRVCGMPLAPEVCREGAVWLRDTVDIARGWSRMALEEFTLTAEERAQPKTKTPLVFLVTITAENPDQFARLGKAIESRGGLGQPNKQRLGLGYGYERVEFLPHDIGRIFSSLKRHMYYQIRQAIRGSVRELERHGHTVEAIGARFRTFASLGDRPATILTELYHIDSKEVLELFVGPTADHEQHFRLRVTSMLEYLGVKTIKVQKPKAAEEKNRKKKRQRKEANVTPAAANTIRRLDD